MKQLLTLLLIFVCFLSSKAQSSADSDSIQVVKKLATTYRLDGKILNSKKLLELTESNPIAYKHMRKAKQNENLAVLFGGVGGFIFGYSLGTAASGGELNKAQLAAGAGLIIGSIPFGRAYDKNAQKAISIYNEGQSNEANRHSKLNLSFSPYGLNMRLIF
ncbi:MAG: hypothetical protein ACPGTP_04095 [Bacteroidia bacterium]